LDLNNVSSEIFDQDNQENCYLEQKYLRLNGTSTRKIKQEIQWRKNTNHGHHGQEYQEKACWSNMPYLRWPNSSVAANIKVGKRHYQAN
jgi:hypothetical protein